MKLTHEWLLENKFKHGTLLNINIYSRNDKDYVQEIREEEFGLRIRNVTAQKPVKEVEDLVELHRIISGIKI